MQLFSAFTMLFFVAFSVFEMFIEIVIQRPQLGNGFLYMNFRLFPWAVIFPYTMYGVYDLMRVGFVLVYLVNARRRGKGSEEGQNKEEEEGEGLECWKVDENDSRTFLRQDNPSVPVFYGSKQ
jgi:hypothetical protein